MKKRKTKNELKKEAWKWFSKYIRQKDKYICYTCGKEGNHAGHYVPQSKGNALRFDERNVHCQCVSCNNFKGGNQVVYALNLERDYGPGILQEFDSVKNAIYKPTHEELQGLIDKYKALVKSGGG